MMVASQGAKTNPPLTGDWLTMSEEEFLALSQLVQARLGIHWEHHKKDMVHNRLRKRLKQLGLRSFKQYCAHLEQQAGGPEWQELYNAVTTNQTSFFREPFHFDYINRHWLPELRKQALTGRGRKLRIWSTACSTGAEPYSLAMTLHQGLGMSGNLAWDVRILASDINTRVLEQAKSGCYGRDEVQSIPQPLRDKYFKSPPVALEQDHYCCRESLRQLIEFRSINLMDHHYPIKTKLDLIFCRNVLIYFERATSLAILRRLIALLQDGGYLMLGHAEAMPELDGVNRLPNNIYRKPLLVD